MSVPSGPKGARGGIRNRGSSHGPPKPRDSRTSRAPNSGQQAAISGPLSNGSRKPTQAPRSENHIRNKAWRNPAQLSSAILDHAGKLPKSQSQGWRDPLKEDHGNYKKRMNDLYQTLKDGREKERKEAIRNGFLADPDKPTSLANAITPVGTCQDFCPEFERVERIVQLMVDGSEKATSSFGEKVPLEALMVKRFRRSAAGYDEQLPSDIRPPLVLKKTLDYLFDGVVGGPEPLATVHKFVWDRTRGIRNDFSIQQVTKIADLKIAIQCFERIARFHILALHQLSREGDQVEFDHHQEREQLNNTLLSLMYYYDDSRHRLTSPNEAEFRAYCIIFEIQDQRPDLEDRAQNWPRPVLKDPRVQTALKLYAAAANTSDEQGPLRPRTAFTTAQANGGRFWQLIQSHAVSYVMACVAEIYFNLVRSAALESIWIAYKGKRGGPTKIEDWGLKDLTLALGFDSEDQTWTFCEDHELQITEKGDGVRYIDLGSASGAHLKDSDPRRKQMFSQNLVEEKRFGRTLPAVVNGISASQARSQGLVEECSETENASVVDDESLFLNDDSEEEQQRSTSRSRSPQNAETKIKSATPSVSANPFQPRTTFGLPSSTPNRFQSASTLQSQVKQTSDLDAKPPLQRDSSPSGSQEAFNFNSSPKKIQQSEASEGTSPFSTHGLPKFNFVGPSGAQMPNTRIGSASLQVVPPIDRKSVIIEQPFSLSNSNAASSQIQTNGTAGAFSSIGASPFLPRDASSSAKTSIDAKKPDTSNTTKTATEPKLPAFSFGSSPFFPAVTAEEPNAPSQTEKAFSSFSAFLKPQTGPVYTAPPILSTQQIPTTNSINFKASTSTTSERSSLVKSPLAKLFPASSPRSSLHGTNEIVATPAKITQAQGDPPVPAYSSDFRSEPPKLGFATPAQVTNPLNSSFASKLSSPNETSSNQGITASSPLNLRRAVLDELSISMMLEEGGLVKRFIENAIGPIIDASLAQFRDEKSWEDAMEAREFLLANKYWKRWRTNAWDLSLKRRGKERRKAFARSLQNPNRNPAQRRDVVKQFPFPEAVSDSRLISHQKAPTMPSPALKHKRQSLPMGQGQGTAPTPESETSTKRKREDSDGYVERSTPEPSTRSHKCSNTIGTSIMSAPPHRIARTAHQSSVDASKLGDGSLLGSHARNEARRLASNARSDTTKTDYFKLKAMGIDPDTPIIPSTRKRTRPDEKLNGTSSDSPMTTSGRMVLDGDSHDESSRTPSRIEPGTLNDDDDEALFESIRTLKATLADSASWFKSERESIERSFTPQNGTSPRSAETSAQRRLREIRERGPTPSRARLRLQAMGDHAFIPKGFWDGQGMGLSLHGNGGGGAKETLSPLSGDALAETPVMGFAAMGVKLQPDHMVNGDAGSRRGGVDEPQKQGASMDDAIEL